MRAGRSLVVLVLCATGCDLIFPFGVVAPSLDARPDAPPVDADARMTDLQQVERAVPDVKPDVQPDLKLQLDHGPDAYQWPACPSCGCGKTCDTASNTCVCSHPTLKCSIPPTQTQNQACATAEGSSHCCQLGCCTDMCFTCP